MLRSRKQSVHSFLECRIYSQRAELAHHGAGNWKPARDVLHLREGCFLRRADVNEEGNEDQEWVPEQSEKPKDERKSLPNRGRDLRGAGIAHTRSEECA